MGRSKCKKFLGQEEVKAEKIILGIPFYTRVWKEINGNVISSVVNIGNVNNLIPSNATKTWDEDLQQYYVEYKKVEQHIKFGLKTKNQLKQN